MPRTLPNNSNGRLPSWFVAAIITSALGAATVWATHISIEQNNQNVKIAETNVGQDNQEEALRELKVDMKERFDKIDKKLDQLINQPPNR